MAGCSVGLWPACEVGLKTQKPGGGKHPGTPTSSLRPPDSVLPLLKPSTLLLPLTPAHFSSPGCGNGSGLGAAGLAEGSWARVWRAWQ